MPHIVSGYKNIVFTPFILIWCSVSAISEVDGIKLQNFTGSLVLLWTVDFDIFNLLIVSGRLKLQEKM